MKREKGKKRKLANICHHPDLMAGQYAVLPVIASITNFLIVTGFRYAYLSRIYRRAITWVSNYRHQVWAFCNWIPVIGYPRDFHVSYARFNGFLRNVFYSFQNLLKAQLTFSFKRDSQKTFLFRNLLQIRLISNWTSCRIFQGIIVLRARPIILKLLERLLPELYSTRPNY